MEAQADLIKEGVAPVAVISWVLSARRAIFACCVLAGSMITGVCVAG